jgi:hypothetical protein
MLTASPDEPLGASSEEIVVPRYLLYFAIPPAITTLVLSILDPMLGMTLLTCSFVMWVVLRIVLRQAPIQCQSGTVEESVLKARGLPGLGQSRLGTAPTRARTRAELLAEDVPGPRLDRQASRSEAN